MDNCFILLGLSFDPPENDLQKINAAISQKQQEWAKERRPKKQIKARENLECLSEIKRIMLDSGLRNQEAEKAKEIKSSKEKELEEEIAGEASGLPEGGTLSEAYKNSLLETFGAYGFSKKDIERIFEKKRVKPRKKIDTKQVIAKSQAKLINQYMSDLDMQDKTLYDFLELSPSAAYEQLREAAAKKSKRLLDKGKKEARDEAVSRLCSLCGLIFKNEEGKNKYDYYLKNLAKFPSVNRETDKYADRNHKKIEPNQKESLIDTAVRQYHISVSEASGYINDYCAYMGYAMPGNTILCVCGAESPAGSTNCVKCGKPLFITCPNCGKENNNSAKKCSCGFDLTKMDQAVELLNQAKQKYTQKDLKEAERLAEQAELYWPKHPDIIALQKSIAEDQKAFLAISEAIQKNVRSKKYYAARMEIEKAKTLGFTVDMAVSQRVEKTLAEVESGLESMRKASAGDAFKIALHLTEMVADSAELTRCLEKYPPEECAFLRGKQVGDAVELSWGASKSVGNIIYHLVRKENVYPNNAGDGVSLYVGGERNFTDQNIKKNTVYCYAVFAERVSVFSRAVRLENPIALVGRISHLKAIGGDQTIVLSWEKTESVREIRVWKYCGESRPDREEDYESVPCPRLDGLQMNGLQNGAQYWFAVSAGHVLNGKTYYSEKEYCSAVPQRPAQPLQDFSVKLTGDVFQASWKQSEWDVILFYAQREPEIAVGVVYDLNELLSEYKKIDVTLKNPEEAEFRLDFIGECYIIPGVLRATNVVLNKAAYISSVPAVKAISYDLNTSATEMYVNFTWPKKIDRSVLVYRMDEYPTGVDDPLAHRIECSRKQYDMNAGILVNNPLQGTYYATVYTFFEKEGRRIYSEGVRALFSNEPQKDVYYTLKYKKGGFFGKKYKLSVTVETDGNCVFPGFAVIGKYKSTPLKRGDGNVVYLMKDSTEIHGSYTFEADVEALRPDMRLKMFFLNDKNYRAFRIACKAGNKI